MKAQTGGSNHQVKGQNANKLNSQKLAEYVQQHPDAYLHEIAEHFHCSKSAIFYALKKSVSRVKKKTTTYKEQDLNKAKHYLNQLAEFFDYQHVYLDETWFDTYLFRPYARSPKGQVIKAQISGKKYQFLSLVAVQIGNKLIAPMIRHPAKLPNPPKHKLYPKFKSCQ